MFKTATLLFFTVLLSDSPKAQDWQRISPESASTHLLKKVDPVYPAFAKAAGLEGVVCIEVGIYPDGRIHSVSVESGPPALIKAAEEAVSQYIYRPFEKDGAYVVVQTNLDVIFKVPKPPGRRALLSASIAHRLKLSVFKVRRTRPTLICFAAKMA